MVAVFECVVTVLGLAQLQGRCVLALQHTLAPDSLFPGLQHHGISLLAALTACSCTTLPGSCLLASARLVPSGKDGLLRSSGQSTVDCYRFDEDLNMIGTSDWPCWLAEAKLAEDVQFLLLLLFTGHALQPVCTAKLKSSPWLTASPCIILLEGMEASLSLSR